MIDTDRRREWLRDGRLEWHGDNRLEWLRDRRLEWFRDRRLEWLRDRGLEWLRDWTGPVIPPFPRHPRPQQLPQMTPHQLVPSSPPPQHGGRQD